MNNYSYIMQVLIALDQLLNSLIPGGWADETISSRCYRWHRDGIRSWPRNIVNTLFFWEPRHCEAAYQSEKNRLQAPAEIRPNHQE